MTAQFLLSAAHSLEPGRAMTVVISHHQGGAVSYPVGDPTVDGPLTLSRSLTSLVSVSRRSGCRAIPASRLLRQNANEGAITSGVT